MSLFREILKCICSYIQEPRFLWLVSINGNEISGDVIMVRYEFNQEATFTASPVDRRGNPTGIDPGSAEWSVVATDVDGNDVSDSLVLTVDPVNELSATLRSTDVELTGVLTLRADGDPDEGEYAPIIGTVSIIVDASNAVAFNLTNTEPTDV